VIRNKNILFLIIPKLIIEEQRNTPEEGREAHLPKGRTIHWEYLHTLVNVKFYWGMFTDNRVYLENSVSLFQRIRGIQALSKTNLVRLALVSIFLTVADTIQSFYFQKVIDIFSEGNALPRAFYNTGPLGYVMYAPIEFLAIFATLTIFWLWASYVIWFHKNIVATRHLF
jgi:hypothetical protein